MPKKQLRELIDLVPHPRYGTTIRTTQHDIPVDEIRKYRGYQGETIFPESAIPADTSKQNFSTFPRSYYVDVLKRCRDCERNFLFFAEEQRFWYESLGIYIDADCVYCPECRKRNRANKQRLARHHELINKPRLTIRESVTLAEEMVEMWRDGVITDASKLGRVKNIAVREIPTNDVTQRIVRLAAEVVEKGMTT